MTRTILVSVLAVSCLAMAPTSRAEEAPSPEELAADATATRQAVFKLLYFNLKPIAGMARGQVEFDAAIAERNARRIASLAPMIPDVFSAMDTREFDVTTEALPVIWEKPDEFSEKARELVEAANTFAATAAGGDQAATLGGLRSLGGACGNCHDTFRVDDD
jgi:cytochrome c556